MITDLSSYLQGWLHAFIAILIIGVIVGAIFGVTWLVGNASLPGWVPFV